MHDDPLLVTVSEDVQSNGFQCVAGSSSCSLAGLSVSDPDCEMTVDGSCFLRLGWRNDMRPLNGVMEGDASDAEWKLGEAVGIWAPCACPHCLHLMVPVKRVACTSLFLEQGACFFLGSELLESSTRGESNSM